MRRISMLLAGICAVLAVHAQGISFETGSWKETLAKAEKEHKLIYMDIYTTWCGPCKIMASTIFPTAEAGQKYNTAFVNYKIDAEKGEGIALAKQYKVEGYPTNLYIDPKTQKVVYRVMGATDIKHFLERADIALQEQKDPMQWKDYEQKFEKGSRDKAFLEAYMAKAKRLNQSDDKALDAYVDKYVPAQPSGKDLKFLSDYTWTLDNKAVAILFAHKDKVAALYPEQEDYFTELGESLLYATLEKAIDRKEERLLKTMEAAISKYRITPQVISGMYNYTKDYYSKTGNDAKAWEAAAAEANYLCGLSAATYQQKDKEGLDQVRSSILYQLKAMNVPEDKYESSIQATLDKNPDMRHPATLNAAQLLNATAWQVTERKRTDKSALATALKWSGKSLELIGEGSSSWPLYADTYANLLYHNGEKEKAVAKEEEAVKRAEAGQMEGWQELKESLEKMKSDQL